MRNISIIVLLIMILSLSGCGKQVYYSASDFLEPLEAGQEIDIPERKFFEKPTPPFEGNPDWVAELSQYIPVHPEGWFMPGNDPVIEPYPLDRNKIQIETTIYYEMSSEDIFTWTADHLADVGLKENRNLPEGENTYLFVPADGSGSIKATDGVYNMDIDFERDETYEDWLGVTYSGYRFKPSQ